jgi:16S rRNA (guanine(966)-N(2))-methyltransferase RsmD
MSRIIAGTLGGRRVTMPPGRATRPTSDRVREALFSSLATLVDLDGCRFADLYAGSGAVGIEALSRGAAHALFVESDARTAKVLRDNVAALGVTAAAELVVAPVARAVARRPAEPYQVIFADPPYDVPDGEVSQVLAQLVANDWLAEDAVVVLERRTRDEPPRWLEGVTGLQSRRYGETTLWYGRAS